MSTSPISTWCCPTTPPVSMAARMTSPRKHRPHGKPPSAGTTRMQSSGLPKFERSEQRQRIERPHREPDSPGPPLHLAKSTFLPRERLGCEFAARTAADIWLRHRYINPARHVRAFGVRMGQDNDGNDTIERRPR